MTSPMEACTTSDPIWDGTSGSDQRRRGIHRCSVPLVGGGDGWILEDSGFTNRPRCVILTVPGLAERFGRSGWV